MNDIIKIKESQIQTLKEAGYEAPTATLHFHSDENDDFFTVTFKLSSGVDAQFVGDRDKVRKYRNPTHFVQWAKKHGIKKVAFSPIDISAVVQKEGKGQSDSDAQDSAQA